MSAPAVAQTRKKRRPFRREQILDIAIRLFRERGYRATGMDDIGAATGITGPGIYRHFKNKEDILGTAVEQAASQILGRVREIVDAAQTPEAALEGLVRNFIHAALNKPDLASLVLTERRVFPADVGVRWDRAHRLHMEEWVHAVSLARPDLDDAAIRLLVTATVGLLSSIVSTHSGLARLRLEELLEGMAMACLLGAEGPAPRRARMVAVATPGGLRLAGPPESRMAPVGAARRGGKARAPRSSRVRRRDLILEVAADLFVKQGFAGTGIDEIGGAAGITGPGVYRHFASKDEILKTLVQQAAEQLLTTNETSPIDRDETPEALLGRMVTTLVDDSMRFGALAFVAWNEARNLSPHTRAWLTRLHRLRAAEWVHVLSRVRPDLTDVDLLAVVNAVYSMVLEAVNYDAGLGPDRARDLLVAAVWRALMAGSAGKSTTGRKRPARGVDRPGAGHR